MPRAGLNRSVLQASVERLERLYRAGHRLVVTFSGGKDSTVTLELAIMAARRAGRLPVEVVVQEEEIAYPGTYEFIERTANRKEVSLRWLVTQQPLLNVFHREAPYWWPMDDRLSPDQWVRKPPAFAEWVPDNDISTIVSPARYPVQVPVDGGFWADAEKNHPGQKLLAVIGLRVSESRNRAMGLASSGGYVAGSNALGVYNCRPVYDWTDPDIWKFILEFKVDYNPAYDTLLAMGVKPQRLRVGPPTMNVHSIDNLQVAARAWPEWFDRVCTRLPGVRTAAKFGARVCSPHRRLGETWKECFYRECLGPDTPAWIRARARTVMELLLQRHSIHSADDLPEVDPCKIGSCSLIMGTSWQRLASIMWNGDPFSVRTNAILPYVESYFFRPGMAPLNAPAMGKHTKKVEDVVEDTP